MPGKGLLSVLFAAALVGVAAAHHSAAMFDPQKTVTLQGTVKAYQWINPHCFIQIVVSDPGGSSKEWAIEMGSTKQLYQAGWRPGTLKSGEQITLVAHPERDGSPSALFVSATRQDGAPVVAPVRP
jgi:hypothetical protein